MALKKKQAEIERKKRNRLLNLNIKNHAYGMEMRPTSKRNTTSRQSGAFSEEINEKMTLKKKFQIAMAGEMFDQVDKIDKNFAEIAYNTNPN